MLSSAPLVAYPVRRGSPRSTLPGFPAIGRLTEPAVKLDDAGGSTIGAGPV
jgi:hypothetical protein